MRDHEGHSRYIETALALARRNLGQAWPNPAVGALLVKDGKILAGGWTARGGRPHAEAIAIEAAGKAAKGATLYVTLEPCAHHGKTPPCVDAIIKAGVARCVVSCRDPHPGHGGGIEKLKGAGIEIVEGVGRTEAEKLNAGFFSVVKKKRPYVALKIATSADGKITTGTDERWITKEPARDYGHLLRSRYDAILTGIGTVLEDDPLLTCRLPGLEDRSPVRVVLDTHFRLPPDSKLAKTAKEVPVWVLSSRRKPGSTSNDLEKLGVKVFSNLGDGIKSQDMDPGLRRDDISSVLTHLAKEGITRLLVEGGQQVTASFLASGQVDRVYWFHSSRVVGKEGLPAVGDGISLAGAFSKFTHEGSKTLGEDTLEILCSRDS